MDVDAAVRDLVDKQAVHEVVLRYCRGIDRLDLDLVRQAYHPGGIDHHTGFSGPIEEFLAWVEPGLRRMGGTTHIVGNHLSEIAGDVAVAETYGQAVHWGEPGDDEPRRNFTTGFRYIDHMTRRDGVWAIQERWASREWTRSDVGLRMAKWGEGPSGRRDADDPLAALRRRLGIG
ncbi:nuclear transport factor 2 family protein [Phenylobacterium sp.]|jgi:hypothetical protein|uniref:nuclear transport factor 2 family protein n=1 Tax=Phenylobacterium sp. TaxID=1871053 RepID=UPI002F3F1814